MPWGNQSGKLRSCTERRWLVVAFWLALAGAVIICGRLVRRAWTCYRWDSRPRRHPWPIGAGPYYGGSPVPVVRSKARWGLGVVPGS